MILQVPRDLQRRHHGRLHRTAGRLLRVSLHRRCQIQRNGRCGDTSDVGQALERLFWILAFLLRVSEPPDLTRGHEELRAHRRSRSLITLPLFSRSQHPRKAHLGLQLYTCPRPPRQHLCSRSLPHHAPPTAGQRGDGRLQRRSSRQQWTPQYRLGEIKSSESGRAWLLGGE